MIDLPLVYVAGPYSGENIANTRRAIDIGEALLKVGVVPLIPHLSAAWDLAVPHPYKHWLDYDLALLARCDALYRMVGESSGADAEQVFAAQRGLPVLHTLDEVRSWARIREVA